MDHAGFVDPKGHPPVSRNGERPDSGAVAGQLVRTVIRRGQERVSRAGGMQEEQHRLQAFDKLAVKATRIAGFGEPLVGRLLMIDARSMRFETLSYGWDPENPLNGTSAA